MLKLGCDTEIDGSKLFIIAGPCVLEDETINKQIVERLIRSCKHLNLPYIFKASFDKANRTSHTSHRGPGFAKGIAILADIKDTYKVPVTTDIHESWQVEPAAEIIDIIQIPAFLCRQTDLLEAAAKAAVKYNILLNIKKGQFLAPWDMKNVVDKIEAFGAKDHLILTERGTSFGYNTLVSDMRSIPIMQKTGCPVVFDCTHSVQMPGGLGDKSGGQREYAPLLAQCAVVAGCDGVFLETHPDPDNALSDGPNNINLEDVNELIISLNTLFLYQKWRQKDKKCQDKLYQ